MQPDKILRDLDFADDSVLMDENCESATRQTTTKLRLFDSLVVSIMSYGSETWPVNAEIIIIIIIIIMFVYLKQ